MTAARAVVSVALAFGLSCPASAQWQRFYFSGKGDGIDVPVSHPLSYFTANPFLRDDGDDLCFACTPEDKANSGRKYAIGAVVEPVGVLAGYRIVDVLCYLGPRGNGNPSDVKWKFILVQVGPDRYKEIFHLQAFHTTISVKPSQIIRSGKEPVLATMDYDGGNGGGCWEAYWWFDRGGPHVLDFSRVEAAIRNKAPGNTRFSASCGNLDLKSRQIHSGVQEANPKCHACDWTGEVTATFRLAGSVAEPTSITYKPTTR